MKKIRYCARIIMYISFICAGLGTLIDLSARESSAYSEDRFFNLLRKYDLSVVLFYYQDSNLKKNKEEKREINNILRDFKSVSKVDDFDKASILFMTVNLAREKVKNLAKQYKIATKKTIIQDQPKIIYRPTVVLFKDGQLFNDVRIEGNLSKSKIKTLINKNFNLFIIDILKKKEKERKKRLEEKRYQSRYYTPYYFGYDWGWPYYRSYRWPYYGYRRYYRPYWGWGTHYWW